MGCYLLCLGPIGFEIGRPCIYVMVPKILLFAVTCSFCYSQFYYLPAPRGQEGVICRLFDIGLKEEAIYLQMRRETSRFVVTGNVMSTQVRCSAIYER